jgi:Ca2+-binding RTX toxin-like protein
MARKLTLLGTGLLLAATVLAPAAPAHAGTTGRAYYAATTLVFQAGDGVANSVTIDAGPSGIRIADTWPITPGAGCAAVTSTSVLCTAKVAEISVQTLDGADRVYDGTSLPCLIDTGDGDDVVFAQRGGPKSLAGGPGIDNLLAGPGSDKLYGQTGDDQLSGGDGADYLDGGDGNDELAGGAGTDVIAGGPGLDTASYRSSTADVVATLDGIGNDGAPGENDTIVTDVEGLAGGDGNDTLTGNDSDNGLDGGTGGTDLLYGLGGYDHLFGGLGQDVLNGGDGDDWLDGGDDADWLFGGGGGDRLNGRGGGDYLSGGNGPSDFVLYATDTEQIIASLDGVAGNDGAVGEGDTIAGDVEGIFGGSGPDILVGNGGANELYGGPGNDAIYGAAGNDRLFGEAGNDHLYGEAGYDHLDGGDGTDGCMVGADGGTTFGCP